MNRKNTIKIIGFFYFFLSCYFAFLLRNILPIELFNLIIIICISTDLGGFFFGKVLKGPKLTKISPKKTYSGMVGSFILSITVSIVYIEYFNLSSLILMNFSIFNIHNSIFNQVTFIILISLISQVGDLVISYFKRLSKIKDTGKLLPGHGGLLDRVDGIIFAIPFSYLLFKLS
jgi:phosphatidate cytidylyltransferase